MSENPRLIFFLAMHVSKWPAGTTWEEVETESLDPKNLAEQHEMLIAFQGSHKTPTFDEYCRRARQILEKTWHLRIAPEKQIELEKVAVTNSTLEETIKEIESLPQFLRWAHDPRG